MVSLNKMKTRIHYEAKDNIDLAQMRYKKDRDKKFCKEKVIIIIIANVWIISACMIICLCILFAVTEMW